MIKKQKKCQACQPTAAKLFPDKLFYDMPRIAVSLFKPETHRGINKYQAGCLFRLWNGTARRDTVRCSTVRYNALYIRAVLLNQRMMYMSILVFTGFVEKNIMRTKQSKIR